MGPKAILTEEEKEARKKRRAEQAKLRYRAKCGAAREKMLQAIREARWRKTSALDDSQRRAMLQAKRDAERRRVAAMTDEQREHYKQKREAARKHRAAMTQQQRDEHHKLKREAVQQGVAALRQHYASFAAEQTRSPCADAVPRTPQCVVPGCSSRSAPSSILYPFPAKPSQRQAWIDFVRGCPCGGARDWNPPIKEISLVCSLHFTVHCFRFQRVSDFSVGYRKRLIVDAVPTLYPIEEQCSLVASKNSTAKSAALLGSSDDENVERRTCDSLAYTESVAGLTNAMSLGECITVAKVACPTPSKVIGQVEVGTQFSLPLADKSVGCSFKAERESRSVQTTETVDQSSSTSVSRPSISPSTASDDNSQQGCLHQCRLCDYETDKLVRLEEHGRVHTGERLFKCDVCLQSFSRKNTLNRHLFLHTGKRPFVCHVCSQCFSLKTYLNDHLRTHTGEKPFQCPLCLQKFSQKPKLQEHLRTHTGEKPFQCPSCPRSFSLKGAMKRHLRTHTGEKPYQCPTCLQRFSQKYALTEHLRTHTGEKPFKCPSCPLSFSLKGGVTKHLRSIHTDDRPYCCTVCSKSFARSDGLIRHKRTLHHDTVE
ncbi:zinc finger protein 454-like [Dermacentor silvarum]|uniref:zinc finger protein 454-like n=1 Tax=Dermacentor silvarum TaxID=543639 RepID=UPI00189A7AB0|nr:zinc finger protein 454-like [Dermacentor silvarum]